MKMKVDQFISQYNHINYCEIVILPDGYIMKAIPSHTEVLIEMWCKKHNKTRNELKGLLIISDDSPLGFLCDTLQCIAVWYSQIKCPKSGINKIQLDVLQRLISAQCINDMNIKNLFLEINK